jgi:glucose/arabinose dehydrogenase
MSAGSHRLEITALYSGLESPKSESLYVLVAGTKSAVAARAGTLPRTITTSDGVRVTVETLATGLDMPSALAATPDGRLFIAQGSGDVHVWQANQLLSTPAVTLAGVQRAPGVGLVGMALDTNFAANGHVFVAYVGRARDGAIVNRVVRFRELKSVFAEATVILEDPVDVVAARPPRIRMGRDRKLYVAFPAVDWRTADSFASYSGKILRINEDGTTPRDNPRSSPIISASHAASGSFDWQPSSGRLWLSERDRQGRDVLGYFSAGFDSAVAASFASSLDASGAAFYPPNAQSDFANDLFIAGLAGQQLRRVHFNPRDAIRIDSTENLLEGQYGRLSDVIAGPDGALYVSTSNRGAASSGPDDDRLLRVSARR